VIAKGDPIWLELGTWKSMNFPADASGRYPGFTFAHSIAAIAHLEARRANGGSFLLVPKHSEWWREQYPEFAAHLTGRYEVVADEPEAGLLVDLKARRAGSRAPRTITELVEQLDASNGHDPAVLDWTGSGLDRLLPGRRVFTPPPGENLPYLDQTIDIVLVANSEGGGAERWEEAGRVAALAVVGVDDSRRGTIGRLEAVAATSPAPAPVRFILAGASADDHWRTRLEEALDLDAAEVLDGVASWAELAERDGPVALIEPGVLPLPGCCKAARVALSLDDGVGGVAAKTLASDGSIEAAGTMVFADGSCAGVASGCHQVIAPWHEYRRDSCGGSGLMFFAPDAIGPALPTAASPWERPFTAWAACLWSAGKRVVYEPDALAVRAAEASGDPVRRGQQVTRAWAHALPLRPYAPQALADRAWRSLLASDDVAAAWVPIAQR
jgi:hypothetical protein